MITDVIHVYLEPESHINNVYTFISNFTEGIRGGVVLSSFYWASVANVPNVLQPYWLIVLPLDVPDLTASLLL